jgi:hypothetical protein
VLSVALASAWRSSDRHPASAKSRSHAISSATAAELNCSDAWTSGVSAVMPDVADASSSSACCTRATVAGGTVGAGLGSAAGGSGGSTPCSSASASASACCASASSSWATTTASRASTAVSPASTAACAGSTRSAPAVWTSPTVTVVSSSTSPYRSSAVM